MSTASDAVISRRAEPLSIEQLETGLRAVVQGGTDRVAFWDQNVAAFRRTVLFAIRETSEALLSSTLPPRWRVELEGQLGELAEYVSLADRYIERRLLSFAAMEPSSPSSRFRPH